MYRNIENPMRKGMPLALAVAFASVMAGSAMAQNNNTTPANPGSDDTEKVQAGAVDPKVLKTQSIPSLPSGPGAVANSSGTVELASVTLTTKKDRDLSIRFTSECFVYTQGASGSAPAANANAQGETESQAGVTTWIEVDGQPVPVSESTTGEPDDGKVGLCSRTQNLSATVTDQEAIDLSVLSQSAHGFNWTALNAAAGDHTIKVMAKLDASVVGSGAGNAAAVIGKRTLQVQAVKPSTPPPGGEKKPSLSSS